MKIIYLIIFAVWHVAASCTPPTVVSGPDFYSYLSFRRFALEFWVREGTGQLFALGGFTVTRYETALQISVPNQPTFQLNVTGSGWMHLAFNRFYWGLTSDSGYSSIPLSIPTFALPNQSPVLGPLVIQVSLSTQQPPVLKSCGITRSLFLVGPTSTSIEGFATPVNGTIYAIQNNTLTVNPQAKSFCEKEIYSSAIIVTNDPLYPQTEIDLTTCRSIVPDNLTFGPIRESTCFDLTDSSLNDQATLQATANLYGTTNFSYPVLCYDLQQTSGKQEVIQFTDGTVVHIRVGATRTLPFQLITRDLSFVLPSKDGYRYRVTGLPTIGNVSFNNQLLRVGSLLFANDSVQLMNGWGIGTLKLRYESCDVFPEATDDIDNLVIFQQIELPSPPKVSVSVLPPWYIGQYVTLEETGDIIWKMTVTASKGKIIGTPPSVYYGTSDALQLILNSLQYVLDDTTLVIRGLDGVRVELNGTYSYYAVLSDLSQTPVNREFVFMTNILITSTVFMGLSVLLFIAYVIKTGC